MIYTSMTRTLYSRMITAIQEEIAAFRSSRDLLKKLGASHYYFAISIISSVIVNSLTGLSLGLIVPLAKGIIEQDFSFILKIEFIDKAIDLIPFIDKTNNLHLLGLVFSTIFSFLILKTIIAYCSEIYLTKKQLAVETASRSYIFDYYIQFDQSYFDTSNQGKDVFNLMKLPERLSGLLDAFDKSLQFIIQVGISLLVMIYIWWEVAIVGIFLMILLALLNRQMLKKMKKQIDEEEEGVESVPSFIQTFINRVTLTKMHNKELHERRQYEKVCKKYEKKKYDLTRKRMVIKPTQEISGIISLLIFVFVLSAFSLPLGAAGISKSLAIFVIYRSLSSKIQGIMKIKMDFMRVQISLKKIDGMKKYISESSIKGGIKKFENLKTGIRIQNLQFGYSQKKKVFRGVSFRIPTGKITAIIGKSGHGKSTILKLLLRFYNIKKGKIFLDGENIETYSIKSLRSKMAYVSQKPVLFNDTLWNNVTYGVNRFISKKEVLQLLSRLDLGNFLAKIDHNLNAEIGDGGSLLSGGEQQRLCIARALLKNFEILLLDEATSSLDVDSERKVLDVLKEMHRGKTIILVSHRISTLKNSDKAIFIHEGKIRLKGNTSDLVKDEESLLDILKDLES